MRMDGGTLAVWRHGEGSVAVADPALFQWQVANLANAGVDDLRKNGTLSTA